ncbi:bifunctional hydroxymethylpyrimidine kinase/phosphomethylpyrimidine kinase, partial [uncultured Akkermansia sp.]
GNVDFMISIFRDELPDAAARLAVRYGCPVLLKGGHLEGGCRDVLSGPDGCLLGQWERPRVQDVSTHGTGCSLSAAVAARLAAGDGLVAAVERGLEFIASAIRNHLRWEQPVRVDALKLW